MHGEALAAALVAAGGAVQQAQPGEKLHGAAAGAAQLGHGGVVIAGLAEHVAVDHRHLVGADDQGVRVCVGEGGGLVPRQAQHQFRGRLAGPGALVDVRAVMLE